MRVPIPLPRGNKRKKVRCNPLAKEMYSIIDSTQARATGAPTASTQPISPAFVPVPLCIFQYEHCWSLGLMNPPTEALLTP